MPLGRPAGSRSYLYPHSIESQEFPRFTKRFFVHAAIHGLAVPRAENKAGVFQLLEVVGQSRPRDLQLFARAREGFPHPVAALIQSVPFVEHLQKQDALLAGQSLEDLDSP
jgi:hypothetical protein